MSIYADYDSISTNYDKNRKPTGMKIYTGLILENFRGNSIQDLKVLDVGCGTGNYAHAFVKERIGKLTLTDASEGMLMQAKKKLEKAVEVGVVEEVQQAFLPEIPFPEKNFDVVMFNQVLHHLKADDDFSMWQSSLSNAFKVLKPGGMMILNASPGVQHGSHWYYNLFLEARDEFITLHASKDKIVKMMEIAGFKNVQAIVPLEEKYWLNDSRYFNPEGPLNPAFRDGDSFWSHIKKEELNAGIGKLEDMKRNGTLNMDFVHELDSVRRNNGSFTIFVGYSD